jgi:hypothetical protein
MTEINKPNPLACVTAAEAATFRVGQVARRLLADHPGLPVEDMEPSVWVLNCGSSITAKLEISPGSLDGVVRWAEALGVELRFETRGGAQYAPYRLAKAVVEVDGVEVDVNCTGQATDEEIAAWRAGQDHADAEAVAAGGAR